MLNFDDPDILREEVEHAIKERDAILVHMERRLERYFGEFYSDNVRPADDTYEPYEFELASNMLGHLIFNNPKTSLSDVSAGENLESVQADEVALNQLIKDIEFEQTGRRVAFDALFGFGVFMVLVEVLPGYEDWPGPKPVRPTAKRLSPRRYFRDTRSGDGCRFEGHTWAMDLEEMLEAKKADGTPMYDEEIVRGLGVDADLDKVGLSKRAQDGPARNQIVGIEVYARETGMIYTLGFGASTDGKGRAAFLREPRKWVGDPRGPYVMVGLCDSGDEPYPMSLLAATQKTVNELNAHAKLTSHEAATAKRIGLFDANDKALAAAMVNGVSGTAYGVPGFRREAFEIADFGGPNPASIEHQARLADRIDRVGGLTDARRGNVEPSSTATAEAIADRAADMRSRQMHRMYTLAVIRTLDGLLWIMQRFRSVSFHVSATNPKTGKPESATYVGGPLPGQEPPRQRTTSVNIEPYSMEMVNQALLQARMERMLEVVPNTLDYALKNPAYKVRNAIDDYCQAFNISGGADRYVDFEMLEQMQMAATLTAIQPGGPMGAAAPMNDNPGASPDQAAEAGEVDMIDEQAAMLAGAR